MLGEALPATGTSGVGAVVVDASMVCYGAPMSNASMLTTILSMKYKLSDNCYIDVSLWETKRLLNGDVIDMYPRNGNPGADVIANFSSLERQKALETFHQNYQGGAHYQNFLTEFGDTVSKDLWH